jgi:tRNA/tmRNA/rRNA uracil-C5-methylase (TrmA/RlmC/RlmD family)
VTSGPDLDLDVFEGARVELDIGDVTHGGHWVSHAPDGRVVFVRHALAGERVIAEITEEHPGYLRADAVAVLEPAPARVTPPCPFAGACGGCDFQHVDPEEQRNLKASVVREQLARLARLPVAEIEDLGVRVAALPGGELGWRSRVRYAVDAAGRAGLMAYRSHEVVPVDRCRIAHPAIQALPVTTRRWPDVDEVSAVATTAGDVSVSGSGTRSVRERAAGREWSIPPEVFWQVHPAAPDTFVDTVLELLAPRPDERAWDLYGGVGLFASVLAGAAESVVLVESDRDAVAAARVNLAEYRNVHIVRSTVERFRYQERPDVVVLDPPRSGAGAKVVRALMAAGPRAVGYVSCDPASFARDVATFREAGWRLSALRAFDAFPMTHHIELIGLLVNPSR